MPQDSDTRPPGSSTVSRRQVLTRGAALGAVVWTVPTVTTVNLAFAQQGSPLPGEENPPPGNGGNGGGGNGGNGGGGNGGGGEVLPEGPITQPAPAQPPVQQPPPVQAAPGQPPPAAGPSPAPRPAPRPVVSEVLPETLTRAPAPTAPVKSAQLARTGIPAAQLAAMGGGSVVAGLAALATAARQSRQNPESADGEERD